MASPTRSPRRLGRRGIALVGLGGALLSGIGDVLLLGRPSSGRDFDQAAGSIPPHIAVDTRWQSLWNGAAFPPRRIQVGTLTGLAGIGILQLLSLRGIARANCRGPLRRLATASAAAFAVSGVLTHLCCAEVISAYGRASKAEPSNNPLPSPRSVTTLLALSAVGALGGLAVFSGCLIASALRDQPARLSSGAVVTPFPCVLSALLTFGALPAPVGGYARPASMSTGLLVYFAVTAASAES